MSDSRRISRDEIVKNRQKYKEEELRFLQSQINALGISETSIPTIGAALDNIHRRIYVIESGDRQHAVVETWPVIPTEAAHVVNQEEYTSSEYDDLAKTPSMRQRTKEAQEGPSIRSPNKNRTPSYYTSIRSHQFHQMTTKWVGYEFDSSLKYEYQDKSNVTWYDDPDSSMMNILTFLSRPMGPINEGLR